MTYEIGSHFEWDTSMAKKDAKGKDWLPNLGDSTLTFSGRNAIEIAIRDIHKDKEVQSVYMPSYCCDSMTDPFIRNDIEIIYYDVSYKQGTGLIYEIDLDKDVDIFFAMSYFGIGEFPLDEAIGTYRSRGIPIIEDITHRLFQESTHSPAADYAIASLRKGFAIPAGGYVTKNGELAEKPTQASDGFIRERLEAMQEKKDYLAGKDIVKQGFLDKFNEAERKLKTVDITHTIDSTSRRLLKATDIDLIRERRKKNASILYEGIKEMDGIEPLIPNFNPAIDGPLFVPVMLPSTEARDSLRKMLIEHNIYCPVHWPQKESVNTIWTQELSLLCDQRYNEEDMHHILAMIKKWDEEGNHEGHLF